MLALATVTSLIVLAAAGIAVSLLWSPWWWILAVPLVIAAAVAVHDLFQKRHSVLRNYPLFGRMRFLLEGIRPEIQQYFIERNTDGRPFDRDSRSVIYERAKGILGEKAFVTERDVNEV